MKPATSRKHQQIDSHNNTLQAIVGICQEEFGKSATYTAMLAFTSDGIIPEISTQINLKRFLLQQFFGNDFYPWFRGLINIVVPL